MPQSTHDTTGRFKDSTRERGYVQIEVDRPRRDNRRTRKGENPAINMWIGPKALLITAEIPGIEPTELNIHVTATKLIFSGIPKVNEFHRYVGTHQKNVESDHFNQIIDLPYRVDTNQSEVHNENGLIYITLKKEENNLSENRGLLETSIINSMRQYFGNINPSSPRNGNNDLLILSSLERYFQEGSTKRKA
jgi:HSP20 family protein